MQKIYEGAIKWRQTVAETITNFLALIPRFYKNKVWTQDKWLEVFLVQTLRIGIFHLNAIVPTYYGYSIKLIS